MQNLNLCHGAIVNSAHRIVEERYKRSRIGETESVHTFAYPAADPRPSTEYRMMMQPLSYLLTRGIHLFFEFLLYGSCEVGR